MNPFAYLQWILACLGVSVADNVSDMASSIHMPILVSGVLATRTRMEYIRTGVFYNLHHPLITTIPCLSYQSTTTFLLSAITMKAASSLATILSILPTLVSANVGISWSIPNTTTSGLKDITFPISMAHTPHQSGIYFAQQFGFTGVKDLGYTGLQPQSNNQNGPTIVHAVFSSFVPGSTTTDTKNCNDGADGGPGVSCAVEIPAPYAHPYNLVVKNTPGTSTWTGTLVDTVLGNSTHIGEYTLPAEAGGIKSSHLGFIEYFLFNAENDGGCAKMPRTEVTFAPPTTNSTGTGTKRVGTLDKPYPYGDCEEESNFRTTQAVGGKYRVSVGYV